MKSIYRRATENDAKIIRDFQIAMALETEGLALGAETCLAGVQAVFADAQRGQYHVCEVDGKVVGSLLITYEWSDWRNGTVWWIQSVYLQPEFRGKKLYSHFYFYIQNLVKSGTEIRGLRLYVDHSNKKAQGVYSKLGMNGEHYKVFEWMKS